MVTWYSVDIQIGPTPTEHRFGPLTEQYGPFPSKVFPAMVAHGSSHDFCSLLQIQFIEKTYNLIVFVFIKVNRFYKSFRPSFNTIQFKGVAQANNSVTSGEKEPNKGVCTYPLQTLYHIIKSAPHTQACDSSNPVFDIHPLSKSHSRRPLLAYIYIYIW